jgi:hypothetical protein
MKSMEIAVVCSAMHCLVKASAFRTITALKVQNFKLIN